MDILRNFISTLVATLILITAIELIAPDNSMKKYLKFVLGLILMAVILNPIINFFTKGESILTEAIDKYEKEIISNSEKNNIKTDNKNNNLQEESFKKNFNKNCESLLSKKFTEYNFSSQIDCTMDFTKDDLNFKINKLRIGIKNKNIKKIEKIDLNKNTKEVDESVQKEIKDYLSDELDVDRGKIEIYYD